MNVREDFFEISTRHKHNSSDMQELKFPNTKISSTLHEENKRAKRPWIAHLSIQTKSQTFNSEIWVTFDQRQRKALTFDTHPTS